MSPISKVSRSKASPAFTIPIGKVPVRLFLKMEPLVPLQPNRPILTQQIYAVITYDKATFVQETSKLSKKDICSNQANHNTNVIFLHYSDYPNL